MRGTFSCQSQTFRQHGDSLSPRTWGGPSALHFLPWNSGLPAAGLLPSPLDILATRVTSRTPGPYGRDCGAGSSRLAQHGVTFALMTGFIRRRLSTGRSRRRGARRSGEEEIRVQKLAVRELPRSGGSEQLPGLPGLDAARIVIDGAEGLTSGRLSRRLAVTWPSLARSRGDQRGTPDEVPSARATPDDVRDRVWIGAGSAHHRSGARGACRSTDARGRGDRESQRDLVGDSLVGAAASPDNYARIPLTCGRDRS
jgi:hypothetical protein